jgi:hypothetical protein
MSTSEKNSLPAAAVSQLDLFTRPRIQNSVERSYVTEHRPISTLSSCSFIEYNIPTAVDEYILLNETYLYIKLRVNLSHRDRTKITDEHWKGVYPANYMLHTLFKQIEVQINGKEIVLAPQTYAYRAYVEALLGFTDDAKKSHLTSSLWYTDTDDRNAFFLPKGSDKAKGSEVDLTGRIHLDLTFQDRALLGGVELKLKLTPHSSDFVMQAATSVIPSIEFTDAAIFITRLQVSQNIVTGHARALASATAKYPLTRCEVRQITIPKDVLDAMLDNVVMGQLPRRIFVFMVPNDAFNGSLAKDPFFFKHYDLNYMAAFLDGVQYPVKAFQPNFENNLYQREFMGLFQALNQNGTDSFFNCDRNQFKNGNTIFGINFAPDLSNGACAVGHVNPIKSGSMRLQLRFGKALPETVTVLVYCEFDKVMDIGKDRNIVN